MSEIFLSRTDRDKLGQFQQHWVCNPKEDWQINVDYTEGDAITQREITQIEIKFGDKTWTGTIQDFFAIQAIAENTSQLIHDIQQDDVSEKNVKELQTEIRNLRLHFKK